MKTTGIRRHRLRALFVGSKDWEHSGADHPNRKEMMPEQRRSGTYYCSRVVRCTR